MDIAEIRSKISAFEGDISFASLKTRWDKDFNLTRLRPFDAGKGYIGYTSNGPRLLVNHIVTKLSEAKLLLRVPEEGLTDEESHIASNNEKLVFGAIQQYNDEALNFPDMQPLQHDMGWHSAVRGGYALRVWVHKDEDTKETSFGLAVWDLYEMRFGVGKNGLGWAAHCYMTTKEDIKSRWDYDAPSNSIVWDIYDEKDNAVLIGSEWAKKPTPHGLDYTPVWVMKSGFQPKIASDAVTNPDLYRGESVLANNRDIYPAINQLYSDYFTVVHRGVKVPMGYWSTTGRKQLDGDIWQVEKASSVPLLIGEKIEPILAPTMPEDAAAVVNIAIGEEQRGGLSHVAMGDLGFRLSGYAISQLKESIEGAALPSLQTVERGYKVIAREVIKQFGNGNWQDVSIRGRDSRGQQFGVPKTIRISPRDVNPEWIPEVKLTPVLPRDDAQRYELAALATQGDTPLLSQDTAREMLMELPDPKLENEKISREWAKKLPTNRLFSAFVGALALGDQEEAANVMAELRKYMETGTVGGGGGGGQKKGVSGVPRTPSSVMPDEERGGVPPGAQNAKPPPAQAEELE